MFKWIMNIFAPVNEVLKTVDISGNARRELQNAFAKMEADLMSNAIELEKAKLDMHAKVVLAESQSSSKLAQNWRPVASLVLLSMCCVIAVIAQEYERIFDLTMVIVGGHVGGRTLEGVAKSISLSRIGKK